MRRWAMLGLVCASGMLGSAAAQAQPLKAAGIVGRMVRVPSPDAVGAAVGAVAAVNLAPRVRRSLERRKRK